ncbi:MAG: hypothetical protein LBB85_07195 [Dysgonamonadaceae bacterium]|jgi:hypothetical protein|nr:hypothetical protein [Dysgonamonadaceae bacterium]
MKSAVFFMLSVFFIILTGLNQKDFVFLRHLTTTSNQRRYRKKDNNKTIIMMNEVEYMELIRDNQKELLTLLEWSVDIIFERFQTTPIYHKILHLDKRRQDKDVKSFSYAEQKLLECEIHTLFPVFINNLKKCCSPLTEKELLICCLSLRLHPHTVSLCMGYNDAFALKTHKHNIKRKMVELSKNQFLFDFIFQIRN